MSEPVILPQEQKVEEPKVINPFDDDNWSSIPKEPVSTQNTQKVVEPVVDSGVVEEDEYLNTYFKREFGVDPAAAKTEWDALRKLKDQAQTPAEIKFANDQSKQFFDLLKEGKIDDVYGYLHQQKQIERLEKLELTQVSDAAEIIKANLQFKHKDLSKAEIDFLFNKRYSIPNKPLRIEDEADDEYTHRIEAWQTDVKEKEQELIIEAKLAKPEFAKYKSELILPDIQNVNPAVQEPDQKSLEAAAEQRTNYLKQLESGYRNFNGFETRVKDESVEIPISFNVPDEERVAYYNKLKEFDVVSYFGSRWFGEKGDANVQQMMSDLYLLENPGKVFQGMANNSASKRLDEYLKIKSNIKIDGTPQGTFQPDSKDAKQKEADVIWGA